MYVLKTLSKFNKDKTFKYFPGCSIVNNFDNVDLIENISKIKDEMKESNLFNKYVFLPKSSYHMTISDLFTYHDLGLFKEEEMIKKDSEVIELLKDLNFNLNIEMVLVEITPRKLILKPKTELDLNIINEFRKEVFKRLDILNKDYVFHISISYKLIEVNDHEKDLIDKYLKKLFEKHKDNFNSIKINVPTLVAFNDMSEFRDLKLGRKNLGFY